MADLYVRQGHHDQAIAIYRQLIEAEPGNLDLRRRLRTIEGKDTMSFREHTQGVVDSISGAIACTVMGFDGIPIDTYEAPGITVDIATLMTEYSAATIQLRNAAENQPEHGELAEFSLELQELTILVRPLTEEYLLGVVLQRDALVGKARFLLRITAPKILAELV